MKTTLGRILNLQIRWNLREVMNVMARRFGYTPTFLNSIENGYAPVPREFYAKLKKYGYIDNPVTERQVKGAIRIHAQESLAAAEVSLVQTKMALKNALDDANKAFVNSLQDDVDEWHVLIRKIEREGVDRYYGLDNA